VATKAKRDRTIGRIKCHLRYNRVLLSRLTENDIIEAFHGGFLEFFEHKFELDDPERSANQDKEELFTSFYLICLSRRAFSHLRPRKTIPIDPNGDLEFLDIEDPEKPGADRPDLIFEKLEENERFRAACGEWFEENQKILSDGRAQRALELLREKHALNSVARKL
jgi:hypothetical protein